MKVSTPPTPEMSPRALDLDALRLPNSMQHLPAPTKKLPRHRVGEKFLKGPIPWRWLQRAGRLKNQALQVALLLWLEAGMRKHRTVKFREKDGAEMGMSIDTARRGLRQLEKAQLVTITKLPGRSLIVTLNDAT